MIASITRLWDHGQAVAHALRPGPGRQPTPVAGSADVLPNDTVQPDDLAQSLRRPLLGNDYQTTPADRQVWSCTIQLEPGESGLSDDQWAHVARRVVAAAGLAADAELSSGCPWVAIRTCDPRRLIVLATLMRADGSRPDLRHTAPRVRAVLQVLTRTPLPARISAASVVPTPAAQRRHR